MRIPRRIGCEPGTRDQHIEQIRTALPSCFDCAFQCRLEFRRMADLLTFYAVSAGEMRELHIRTTEITDHVLVLLPRTAAFHHDVVAWLVIAAVVEIGRAQG